MMGNDKQVKLRRCINLFLAIIFIIGLLALAPEEIKAMPMQVEPQAGESGSQPTPFPDLYMRVYPENNRIVSSRWKSFTPVQIRIDGELVHTVGANERGQIDVTLSQDIKVGDIIQLSQSQGFGVKKIEHKVEYIEITELNIPENTISGRAESGKTVQLTICIIIPRDQLKEIRCLWPTLVVGASGTWEEDFSSLFSDKPNAEKIGIDAQIKDVHGNSTIAQIEYFYPPTTRTMTVYPLAKRIISVGWPGNATGVLKIDGEEKGSFSADDDGVVEITLADVIEGGAEIEMNSTEPSETLTYTVENLEITDLNFQANTVIGLADEDKEVFISVFARAQVSGDLWIEDWLRDTKFVDHTRTWSVNFKTLIENFPLPVEEIYVFTRIEDDDGNATVVDLLTDYHYHVEPNRTMTVYPLTERIVSVGWPDNADISLEVDGSYFGLYQADDKGKVDITLDEVDIQGGTELEMYTLGGSAALKYTVENLMILNLDFYNNTVSGLADVGKEVYISVYARAQGSGGLWIQEWISTTIPVDDTRTWDFDFKTLIEDFPVPVEEIYIYARIDDDKGNATVVDLLTDYYYQLEPNRTMAVYPLTERIVSVGWPESADVFLEVDESDAMPYQADDKGKVDITLDEVDIQGGTELKMYTLGGSAALKYTVENLEIKTPDFTTNSVTGTADEGKRVSVSVIASGQVPGPGGLKEEKWLFRIIDVDDSGAWYVDFSRLIEEFSIPVEKIDIEARISDHRGNATIVLLSADYHYPVEPLFFQYLPLFVR
jgi:hypothetical protein